MIFVHQIMTPSPLVVAQTDTPAQALHALLGRRVHGAPVVDGAGRLVGVVSMVDLANARKTAIDGSVITVADVMTSSPLTVDPGATVYEAAQRMVRHSVHRLIIVEEGMKPVGILSPLDLLRAAVNLGEGFRMRPNEAEENRT